MTEPHSQAPQRDSPTTRTPRTPRTPLRLIWLGITLQLLGEAWDLRWHATHPGELETGRALLEAHLGIFLGLAVLLAGGIAAVAWSRRQPAARARPWLILVLVGAVTETIGLSWDTWRHTQGSESALGHLLIYVGAALAFAAAAVATWLTPRGSPTGEQKEG